MARLRGARSVDRKRVVSGGTTTGAQPTINAGQLGAGANWTLQFEDDFPGTSIDTAKWTPMDSGVMNNVSLHAYNISVAGGICSLTLENSGSGAEICTNPNGGSPATQWMLPVGGFAEARINFPGSSGGAQYNWPAWWSSGPSWPAAGEIDIVEGFDSTLSSLNYHSPAGANNGPHPAGTWVNSFHIYSVHRLRNEVRVYWDGVLRRQLYTTSDGTSTGTPLDNGAAQSLIVNVGNGGGGAVYGSASVVQVDWVRGWIPNTTTVGPTASFTATPLTGTYPVAVQFTNASTGSPTSYSWNFGDGSTSTTTSPSHTYTAAGTYTVTLTATNTAGSNTQTRTSYVTVTAPVSAGSNPITAIGASTIGEKNDTALTISAAAPSGTAVGDLLVATVGQSSSAALTPPTGWTLAAGASSGGTGVYVAKMYKVAAAPDTTATFSFDVVTGRATAIIEALRNVDATTPVDVTPSTVGDTSSTAGVTVPSVTTATAGCRLESSYVINTGTTEDANTPSGWTLVNKSTGTGRRTADAFQIQAAAGATGAVGWTKTGTVALPSAGLLVAWRPATPGGTTGGTAPTPALNSRVVGIDGGVKTNTTNATSVRLKASTDSGGTAGIIYSSAVTPDVNGVAYPKLTGLSSATRYYYRVAMTNADGIETLDSDSVVGRIKVAPTGAANFAFNFAACCNGTDSASMAAIAARGDDLFFHMGDLWYADGSGVNLSNYLTQMGSKVNVANHKAVMAATPSTYGPSDHDASMNNNGNAGTDATALGYYNQAYRRLLPTPTDMPASTGVYHSFQWGRVLFVNIDCRSFATIPSATDNSSKTLLGATQKTWLKNLITASTARVICIIGDAAWNGAAAAGDDAWIGYTTERTELSTFFNASGKNLCYLAGDQHALSYDAGDLSNNSGGLVSFQAAPLNNNASQKAGPWSGIYPTSGTAVVQQYGRIAVTDNGTTVTFAYTGYSSDNTSRLTFSKTW